MVPAARWIQRHVRSALPLSSAGLPTSLLLYRTIGGHEAFCPSVFASPEDTGGIVLAASMREAVAFVYESQTTSFSPCHRPCRWIVPEPGTRHTHVLHTALSQILSDLPDMKYLYERYPPPWLQHTHHFL